MKNTMNASIARFKECIPGTLFWMRTWKGDQFGLTLEAPENADRAYMLLFKSDAEGWGTPVVSFIDEEQQVLSFGTDWILHPCLDLTSIPSDGERPRFYSHLVIGQGGMFFEGTTTGVGAQHAYIPIDGGLRAYNTRPDDGYIRPLEFKIYHNQEAMDRGADPLLHVKPPS